MPIMLFIYKSRTCAKYHRYDC